MKAWLTFEFPTAEQASVFYSRLACSASVKHRVVEVAIGDSDDPEDVKALAKLHEGRLVPGRPAALGGASVPPGLLLDEPEERTSPLARTVAAAEDAARLYLDSCAGNDPTEGEWDRDAWRHDTSPGERLGDLPAAQRGDLWPVYCAALVYAVHVVRPYVEDES